MSTTGGPKRRSTKQRVAIAQVLSRTAAFRTAQELHEELRGGGHRVGLTTVYRTLQTLVEEGAVDVLVTEGGEAIYRRCRSGRHHHHLVCRDCGHSVEIGSDVVEEWAARSAAEHGFSEVTHTAELYGRCAACSSV